MPARAAANATGTVDPAEIARFEAIAAEWWDPEGKFKPLHRLNPVRLAYVRDRAARAFGRDPLSRRPLEGLDLLDLGCGGGLFAEPLSRLGAKVTGVDASDLSVEIARAHAAESGAAVAYRRATAEELAAEGTRFDVVAAMEIVEHVADVDEFMAATASLVAPGGLLFLSTINRTARAFALAVVGAEYVLRWLPRGTHDWRKFLRPSELAAGVRRAGLAVEDVAGVTYNPVTAGWARSRDVGVNYMICARRPG